MSIAISQAIAFAALVAAAIFWDEHSELFWALAAIHAAIGWVVEITSRLLEKETRESTRAAIREFNQLKDTIAQQIRSLNEARLARWHSLEQQEEFLIGLANDKRIAPEMRVACHDAARMARELANDVSPDDIQSMEELLKKLDE